MAYFFRLIACAFALVLLGTSALASVPVAPQYSISDFIAKVGWHPSRSAACGAMLGYYNSTGSRVYTPSPLTSDENCYLAFSGDDAFHKFWYQERTSCPDNSVLVPGTDACKCDPGFDEVGGQCKHKSSGNSCDGLPEFCSGLKGSIINLEGKGMSAPPGCAPDSGRPNCPQGCAGDAVGIGVSYKDSGGEWHSGQEYRVNGSTCTLPAPSDIPQKKESDCAGSVGEVNGVRVCVPNQSASGDAKTSEKQNPDGTSSKTESKTTCENGVCKTTNTTTNKDAAGNVTGTSTSSSTTSQREYCEANKSSSVCAATNGDKNPNGKDGSDKGEGCKGDDCEDKPSKFGGSCASGFTCEGDAINCSISKEIHIRNCQLDDLVNGDLYKAWQGIKDIGDKNVTKDLPGNKRFDISVTDRDDFLSAGSCPADRSIEIGSFGSITLPFSELCPWLQMLGYVNVIFASIAGGLIIIRRQS
ncbi:virulence factor TspB C-terminal domain-related protein [Comamonas resistens]|uniref:virulence factor TspB C-terminal domain-related protein n=1 Tax=Comamonas resistens TaxID=3046670 RepID=UPI0039BD7A1A